MGYCLEKFDRFLNKIFYRLGEVIARHTGYFIIVPIFLSAILATGFQRIRYEDNPEYLFAPTNGGGRDERSVIESHFSMNFSSDFDPSRITRTGRFARFIILAHDNGTLLREDVWDEIMMLDELVHEVKITHDERTYRYEDLCAVTRGECYENKILAIHELIPSVVNGSFYFTYPTMFNSNTFELYVLPLFFGGVNVTDDGILESARALSIMYWLNTNTDRDDVKAAEWEEAVLDRVGNTKFNKLFVSRFTSRTLETELENNTNSVIPFFGGTVGIMLLFSIVTVMMSDWVRSKPFIGLMGVVSAVFAVIAAFGFLIYLDIEFIGINMAAPFLMLGIGIDDTFVMLAAWRRTAIQDPVERRMAQTFADAAVSITITSITDMMSFWIGAITPFPCVKIFCIYTGMAVITTYLWHITFFGGCLALAGYAEANQRHSLCCITVKSRSMSGDESGCYRFFCVGGINHKDPYHPDDNKPHAIMVFFRDYVARFLNIPAIKALVVCVFVLYLLGASWGCTRVKEGLERRRLSRYDSYSVDFYNLEDTFFRAYPYRVQVVLTGDLMYSDSEMQREILLLHDKLENLTYTAGAFYTTSWFREWLSYVERNKEYLDYNITDEESFITGLQDYLIPEQLFYTDVVFSEDKKRIEASRFIIQTKDIVDANADKDMMEAIRTVAKESPLNVTVFNPFFIYFDQYVLVRTTSIQSICLAAGIMMVVSLLFIPNPLCSLWVAFSIVSIEIGVIGYMTLWGVNLDSISMINLIMCIGFSVDFSAHISYAYMSAKVDTPDERVRECLYGLGLPILQGALSTILGILALIFAPSYIFITFFKTVFLVIFFGAMHGIFLLPVLLSLLGPGSCKRRKKSSLHPPAVALSHPFFLAELGTSLPPPAMPNNHEDALRIPRPQSVVGNGPVALARSGAFMVDQTAAAAASRKDDRTSLEKDLGLGTSGEESSESSLSKGNAPKKGAADIVEANGTSTAAKDKRRRAGDRGALPLLEVYSNKGYISDDVVGTEDRRVEQQRRTARASAGAAEGFGRFLYSEEDLRTRRSSSSSRHPHESRSSMRELESRPRSQDSRPRSQDSRPRSQDSRPRSQDSRPRDVTRPSMGAPRYSSARVPRSSSNSSRRQQGLNERYREYH